jgi:hypothetical protein
MALRLEIDNYLVPLYEHTNIEDVSITLRWRDEEGEVAYGFSGTVEFYGKAYEIIRNKLILSPHYYNEFVKVNVYEDCCNNLLIFEGKITYTQIDWCEKQCYVKATIIQFDGQSRMIDCLKAKMIWESKGYEAWYNANVKNNPRFREYAARVARDRDDDRYLSMDYARVTADIISQPPYNLIPPPPANTFFTQKHPFFRYCIETRPNSLLHIAAILTALVGLLDLATLGLGPIGKFSDLLRYWTIDCDKGHSAPFIRDYLKNGCNLCGLDFKSPIFDTPASPYYNTCMLYAPNAEGTFYSVKRAGSPPYNPINRPIMSVYQLLEKLKNTFNAEYKIVGSTLFFDRRDKIYLPEIWKDFSNPEHPDIIEICYEYSKEELPAYAEFSWEKDIECSISNEAKSLYEDIVEYNPNNSFPWLKGGRTYNIPFGMTRFRNDGVNSDPITFWADDPALATLVFPNKDSRPYEGMIIGSIGKFTAPKLIIWDGVSSLDNAKVIRKPIMNMPGKFYYNYPYFICERENGLGSGKPNYNEVADNLYDRFWAINDSRIITSRRIKYKLRFISSCQDITSFSFGKKVKLPIGEGSIENITIKSNEIEVVGAI